MASSAHLPSRLVGPPWWVLRIYHGELPRTHWAHTPICAYAPGSEAILHWLAPGGLSLFAMARCATVRPDAGSTWELQEPPRACLTAAPAPLRGGEQGDG